MYDILRDVGPPHLWRAEEGFKSGCATAGIKKLAFGHGDFRWKQGAKSAKGKDRATALNISHLKGFTREHYPCESWQV
jgi:hypothetical protein